MSTNNVDAGLLEDYRKGVRSSREKGRKKGRRVQSMIVRLQYWVQERAREYTAAQMFGWIVRDYPASRGFRPPTRSEFDDMERNPERARHEHVLMYVNTLVESRSEVSKVLEDPSHRPELTEVGRLTDMDRMMDGTLTPQSMILVVNDGSGRGTRRISVHIDALSKHHKSVAALFQDIDRENAELNAGHKQVGLLPGGRGGPGGGSAQVAGPLAISDEHEEEQA